MSELYGEGVMRDMVTSLRFLVKERRHVQLGVVDHDLLAAAAAIEQLLAATIAPSATAREDDLAAENCKLIEDKDRMETLIDRAYKMMIMAGYRVAEQNPDHNNPIVAWMSDVRDSFYAKGSAPEVPLG